MERRVEARAGEWSARLLATEDAEVSVEAGYHRVTASLGTERPLNCFVYQVPIDAGQAVTRLFRAISVGIDFEHIEPLSVELVGQSPLIHISGKYRETTTGRPGQFKLALSPRRQFPVVCTHDEIGHAAEFEASVGLFLKSFQVAPDTFEESAETIVSEVWRLNDESGTLGFSTFRFYQGANGERVSLEVGSTFQSFEKRLRTTDTVVLESEDEDGLKSGKWLELVDTRPLLQIMVERQPGEVPRYRYVGEVGDKDVKGQFESETALRSSGALTFELLSRAEAPSREDFSLYQYQPAFQLNAGTLVKVNYSEDGGSIQVESGTMSSELMLGADALPRDSRKQNSSQRAELLRRSMSSSSPLSVDAHF